MKLSWSEDPQRWVDVVDDHGHTVGYVTEKDALLNGAILLDVLPPERYLKDPYVRYHAQLAYERGLLNRGQDLNDIQIVLLASQVINQREQDDANREQRFIESMAINNPAMYKNYVEEKDRETEQEALEEMIEWKTPGSLQQFFADLQKLNDDNVLSDEEVEGMTSSLAEDELSELSD